MINSLNRLRCGFFTKQIRRCFSDYDNDLNVYDDDIGTDSISSSTSKINYTFYKKSFAFVVDNPLFTTKTINLSIGKRKMSFLKSAKSYFDNETIFATTLLPRIDLAKTQFTDTNDFYPIGSYCAVNILDNSTISLKALHKTNIEKVYTLDLPREDNKRENNMFNSMGVDKGKYFDQLDKYKDVDMDSLRKKDEPSLLNIETPDHLIHLCDSNQIDTQDGFELSLTTRVKIDYLIEFYRKIIPARSNENLSFIVNYHDIEGFIDHLGILFVDMKFFKYEELVSLFSCKDVEEAVNIAFSLMKRYFLFTNKMQDIGKIAERNIQMKRNREYYNEIYNVVKSMAEPDKKAAIKKFKYQFDEKDAPDHVREVFEENYNRLYDLDKNNSEYSLLKNYVEWISCLPYGVKSREEFDIQKAKEILNKSHYGLDDVKKRILEFLAVGKLNSTIKGKILCLEGPAGVGKTSFAYSVAEALGRNVARISLGGENDVSTLKGFRKTYIGSRPGKIISSLKQCGTENCVIIIDEVDKIGSGNHTGDPQSTLLEILDPEQNNAFTDNFLDYPVDLSNVFFICTANNPSMISGPLLDRMDVISLSSYTKNEKKMIYKNHLLPTAIEDCGLEKYLDRFEIKEEVIEKLVESYCREAGIRSLQKHVNRILERIAFKIIQNQENEAESDKIIVNVDNLNDFVGQAIFDKDELYNTTIPGVVKGLAYNSVGGSVLFVEASIASTRKSAKGIKITGQLGDVMKESMKIAYSYTRNYLKGLDLDFLEKHEVHIHVPEGATPKDGPSAGIAVTSALLSLARGKSLNDNIGMTGEISLKGKVLKIGGLKEKILAAKREKINRVIVPKENEEDIKELAEEIREDVEFMFVDHYREVDRILFETA